MRAPSSSRWWKICNLLKWEQNTVKKWMSDFQTSLGLRISRETEQRFYYCKMYCFLTWQWLNEIRVNFLIRTLYSVCVHFPWGVLGKSDCSVFVADGIRWQHQLYAEVLLFVLKRWIRNFFPISPSLSHFRELAGAGLEHRHESTSPIPPDHIGGLRFATDTFTGIETKLGLCFPKFKIA